MGLLDRIISENINKYLIKESISSIVYHFTSENALLNIIAHNAIFLTSTIDGFESVFGSESFFLSVTRQRSRDIGYQHYMSLRVRLTLDGDMINQRWRGKAISFFGKGGKHRYYQKFPIEKQQVYNESEDRIYSNTPQIAPASKYIKRIDILDTGGRRLPSMKIKKILDMASDAFDIFIYDNLHDFNFQTSNTINDVYKDYYSVHTEFKNTKTQAAWCPEATSILAFILINSHLSTMDEKVEFAKTLLRKYDLEEYTDVAIEEIIGYGDAPPEPPRRNLRTLFNKEDKTLYSRIAQMLSDFIRRNKITF